MQGDYRQDFRDESSGLMSAVGWGIMKDEDFCKKIELRLVASLSCYLPERRAGNLYSITSKEVKIGDYPEKYAGLASRALTSNFVAGEVKPTCHPLGKNNKLIFASWLILRGPIRSAN